MNNHNPAIYCHRCAFQPATRHWCNERVCDDCLTPGERLDIETLPVWVKDKDERNAA